MINTAKLFSFSDDIVDFYGFILYRYRFSYMFNVFKFYGVLKTIFL